MTQRIIAIIQRHTLITWRTAPRIIDLLYWPLVNLIMWGFNKLEYADATSETILAAFLACFIFWQVLFRINMEISFNIFDELLSQNFANIMATPLTFFEMVCALIYVGIIKAFFAFGYSALLSFLVYSFSIFKGGFLLLVFFPLAVASGICIGLIALSCIIYWGQTMQPLIWVFPWGFALLSSIFFAVETLPHWLQPLCWILPMPYLFGSIRHYFLYGFVEWRMIFIGVLLSALYLLLTALLCNQVFIRSKKFGLARLDRYE